MCSSIMWVCCSFDHDINSLWFLDRLWRLEELGSNYRKCHFHDLLETDLSIGSPTYVVEVYEDISTRNEIPDPLGYDFHVATH